MKNWTAHELANYLLTLPNHWVIINEYDGTIFEMGCEVNEAHNLNYIDSNEFPKGFEMYNTDEDSEFYDELIFQPVIVLFGKNSKPTEPEIESINFVI